jgi:hypothetical protein
MRLLAKQLCEALMTEIRKFAEWQERTDEQLVFCESDTDGQYMDEIGHIIVRKALLVVPLFSSQYGQTSGTRFEWPVIKPLFASTSQDNVRRVLGVNLGREPHPLVKDYIFIEAQTHSIPQIAETIVCRLSDLTASWKPESLRPKICGYYSHPDSRFAVSENPSDMYTWHDQIFCLAPNPSLPDWVKLERYLDVTRNKQSRIAIFASTERRPPRGWKHRITKDQMFEMDQLPEAIDRLCNPKCNVFFDSFSRIDAQRLRELVRGPEMLSCSWLGIRWWDVDRTDTRILCSAAYVESVELNILGLRGSQWVVFCAPR